MAGLCCHLAPGLLALPVVFGGSVCPQDCSGVVEDLLGKWGRGHLGGGVRSVFPAGKRTGTCRSYWGGCGKVVPPCQGKLYCWDGIAQAKMFWCCWKGLEPGKLGMGAI